MTTITDMPIDIDIDHPTPIYSERITLSGTTKVRMLDGREIEINRYRMEKDINVTVAHTSKIFTGQRVPSLHVAARISEYLGITMEELRWILAERPKYLANHKQ